MDQKSMGFNAEIADKREKDLGVIFKHALPQDFVKFGLIPEFVGRVPVTVSLEALDKAALVRILKEPRNSLLRQYQALFELDGVSLNFDEDAIEAIAEKTLKRKTGARGLRAIVEKVLMDLMYRVPSDESITHCNITKAAVEDAQEVEIAYGSLGKSKSA